MEPRVVKLLSRILFWAITGSIILCFLGFHQYRSRIPDLRSALEGRTLLEAGYLAFTFLLFTVSFTTQFKRLNGLLIIGAAWILTLTLQIFHSVYPFGTAVAIGVVLEVAAGVLYLYPSKTTQ